MVSLVVFASVVVPLSFALGICAATISFTAWSLFVPLLLSAFSMPMFTTLFLSVLLDCCNSLVFCFVYGSFGRVDWKFGAIFGSISSGAALMLSFLLRGFIEAHEEMLAGAAFYVPFLLAFGFGLKAFFVWRKSRALDAASRVHPVLEEEQTTPLNTVIDLHDLGAETNDENADDENIDPNRQVEENGTAALYEQDSEKGENDSKSTTKPKDSRETVQQTSDESIESRANLSIWASINRYRFKPVRVFIKPNVSHISVRIFLSVIVSVIMGALAGLIYVGGGMMFAIANAAIWRTNVRTSTGTASFMMFLTMCVLTFALIPNGDVISIDTFYYVLLSVPFSMCGAVIGSHFAQRISELKMFICITVALTLLGCALTIQYFIENY